MNKNEKGFTLIEMLIVLTIITVLIILIVPTLENKSGEVHETGCDALKKTVQSQVAAYQLEKSKAPSSLSELESAGFITNEKTTCTNGVELKLVTGKGNEGSESDKT